MQQNLLAKKALLVIDMQIGQCSVEPLPYQRDAVIDNINRLIGHFHHHQQPVFSSATLDRQDRLLQPVKPFGILFLS